jgi:NAD(P)-dependent dehydrogenase (short-subunit alcohol dehydrogenase family)
MRHSNSGPGAAHFVYFADLTRLAEMKRVAAEIADREPPIDVLINNAGALFGTRRLTEDGLEHTFALNHMSYFVVTEGLREAPGTGINDMLHLLRAPSWTLLSGCGAMASNNMRRYSARTT